MSEEEGHPCTGRPGALTAAVAGATVTLELPLGLSGDLPTAGFPGREGATSGTVSSPHLQAEEPEKPSRSLRKAEPRRGAVRHMGRESGGQGSSPTTVYFILHKHPS